MTTTQPTDQTLEKKLARLEELWLGGLLAEPPSFYLRALQGDGDAKGPIVDWLRGEVRR